MISLTHFWQCSHFIPPEKTRKPLVLWCFRGYETGTFAKNGFNTVFNDIINKQKLDIMFLKIE